VADNLPDVYLRFEGIKGGSMDSYHPGEAQPGDSTLDGWIGIKGFSFGFGWGGSESADKDTGTKGAAPGAKPAPAAAKPAAKGAKAGGTLAAREFSFSKAPDVASNILLMKCKGSQEISKAEVVVCRAGGSELSAGKEKLVKIPFLHFIFEKVILKKCSLSVTSDPIPTESIEFKFATVKMESVWTDNATGKREPGDPLSVFFDFDNQKGKTSWGAES
jgi:type VI protein secretion system component Hcp